MIEHQNSWISVLKPDKIQELLVRGRTDPGQEMGYILFWMGLLGDTPGPGPHVQFWQKHLGRNIQATVVYALKTSKLDYCNVLYAGLPLKMVRKLPLVQNAVARMLAGAVIVTISPQFCSISQFFSEPNSRHWVLTFKAL